MTQTGTLDANSGSGAPNVVPLTVLAPVEPVAVHTEFVLASQPLRQNDRLLPWTTGKFCEIPVTPLSRSVPLPEVVRSSCRGPLPGFIAHEASTFPAGMVVDVVVLPLNLQISTRFAWPLLGFVP